MQLFSVVTWRSNVVEDSFFEVILYFRILLGDETSRKLFGIQTLV